MLPEVHRLELDFPELICIPEEIDILVAAAVEVIECERGDALHGLFPQ
jgi:hypothetical protein